jgi:hypothetical protein
MDFFVESWNRFRAHLASPLPGVVIIHLTIKKNPHPSSGAITSHIHHGLSTNGGFNNGAQPIRRIQTISAAMARVLSHSLTVGGFCLATLLIRGIVLRSVMIIRIAPMAHSHQKTGLEDVAAFISRSAVIATDMQANEARKIGQPFGMFLRSVSNWRSIRVASSGDTARSAGLSALAAALFSMKESKSTTFHEGKSSIERPSG